MATKKTNKPKASNLTQQVATRMDVASFARLLAQTLGNDRWFTDEVIEKTFKQSGAPGNKLGKDTSKATKIPLIKSEDRVMTSLMAIHNLLKNSYEDKLKSLEEHNQFKEEHDLEKKKQNDEFLEAIKGLKGTSNAPTATKVKEENDNPGLLGDMLGVLSDLKSVAGILFQVGRFFMFNPIGIALLGAVSLAAFLKLGLDELNKNTPDMKALSPDEAQAMLQKGSAQQIKDMGGREKLEDIIKNGKTNAQAVLDMPETTEEEKEAKKKAMLAMGGETKVKAIAADEKVYEVPAQRSDADLGIRETVPPKAEFVAGKPGTGGAKLARGVRATAWDEKYGKDYNEDGTKKTVTPVSSGESAPPAPAAAPASSGESAPPAPAAPMAAPMSGGESSTSQKFNAVNSENLEMKLPQEPSQRGTTVTNIQKNQQRGESSSLPIPGVRNDEPTFQRMILNSTRVV
jgi:hypothetical protein